MKQCRHKKFKIEIRNTNKIKIVRDLDIKNKDDIKLIFDLITETPNLIHVIIERQIEV